MAKGNWLDNIWTWLIGKKTYIIAIIGAVLGLLQVFGIFVPDWVYAILAAIGLGTLRAAIK